MRASVLRRLLCALALSSHQVKSARDRILPCAAESNCVRVASKVDDGVHEHVPVFPRVPWHASPRRLVPVGWCCNPLALEAHVLIFLARVVEEHCSPTVQAFCPREIPLLLPLRRGFFFGHHFRTLRMTRYDKNVLNALSYGDVYT